MNIGVLGAWAALASAGILTSDQLAETTAQPPRPAPKQSQLLSATIAKSWRPVPLVLRSNTNSALEGRKLALKQKRTPEHKEPPAPGIYKTAPYTCIVIVPGPHPDDQAVKPVGPAPPMPTIEPKLEFIPWSSAGSK